MNFPQITPQHENSYSMWLSYHTPRTFSLQGALHFLKKNYASKIFADRILDFTGPITSALEIGCGTASTLAHLSAKSNAHCTGIDQCKEVIAHAQQTYPQLHLATKDLFHLPYKPRSFDVVYSVGLLEHFSPAQQLKIINIHKRLARKAIVFMTPADSILTNTIFYINKNIRKRTGNWADEDMFSSALLKKRFPTHQFTSFKDPLFGNLLFWFGCTT